MKNLRQFKCIGSLNALSDSPDKDMVCIAGREVLKVLLIQNEIKEIVNLRAGVKITINFSSNDVKWANGCMFTFLFSQTASRQTIVTASTNGSIVVWNLNKSSTQKIERIITEHSRAVNRINFHPTEPMVLLSASQDGTMKLWDLRTKSTATHTFDGKAEACRDVQFSPTNGFDFAAAFENGTIQKWDLRNPNIYERKFSAHNGLALSVDWHPDGRLLASGGRDKLIKLWDVKSDSLKPIHFIQTIAPIQKVHWRPGYDTQIAVCSLSLDHRIQIFDICKPFVPLYTLDDHENTVTSFLWHNSDTIYSCGKDASFLINKISASANKPILLLNESSMAWSPDGNMTISSVHGLHKSKYYEPSRRSLLNRWDEKISVPLYKVKQSVFSMDTDTVDCEAFKQCASLYTKDCNNVYDSLENNAQEVAADLELYHTSRIWKCLKVLLSINGPTRNLTELIGRSTVSPISKISRRNDINNSFADSDSDNNSNPPKIITDNSTSQILPDIYVDRLQSPLIILDILNFFSENSDPQMCVFIYLILKKFIKINQTQLEIWFESYLELLTRMSLWNESTEIILASDILSLRSKNQESTSYQISCHKCKKPTCNENQSICENCKSINLCVYCHKRTTSLYVWCIGCSHGGHISCLKDWFSDENMCPSGCGHQCKLKLHQV